MARWRSFGFGLGAAIALGLIPVPGVAIPETAYVWQRAWTPEVRRAVAEHAASFDQLDVLAAEVNLPGGVALPCIDWPTVRALRRPVALVVRIQHSPPNSADKIVQACREIWMRARAAGVTPAELQIDFDCASSRLAEYVALVKAIRPELRPPRLVVTALPDWLTQPAFHPLAFAVDAFVLQVHSVARPNADQPLVLCDPIAAQQWIRRASLVGRPFRVALPDYGYEVGFDSAGCYLGLAAEGENRTWPKGAAVRSGLADPAGIAALVRTLRRNPPPHLIALSWFRLPTSNDVLCWSWPTLAAVRRGELPQTRFDVRLLSASSGASDIIVVNTGEGFGVPPPLALHLKRRDMLACDLDPDWHSQQDAAGGIFVRPESSDAFVPLRAGERRRIGWLRLAASSHDTISK